MNLLIPHQNNDLSVSGKLSRKIDGNVFMLSFVVHQHEHHGHFDFSIEVNGVLRTWTVPKGPSMNPFDRRLAMMGEEHSIDYKDFEGEIPSILYGSDMVEIWDSGTYTPMNEKGKSISEEDIDQAIEGGNVNFLLRGNKLKGEFALIKLHHDDDKAWLLIKQR